MKAWWLEMRAICIKYSSRYDRWWLDSSTTPNPYRFASDACPSSLNHQMGKKRTQQQKTNISIVEKSASHPREINRAEEVVKDVGCHLITS